MLVLSRKPGETVCVGEEITVRVLEVQGNRVQIGIEAPDQVTILRGELHSPFNSSDAGLTQAAS